MTSSRVGYAIINDLDDNETGLEGLFPLLREAFTITQGTDKGTIHLNKSMLFIRPLHQTISKVERDPLRRSLIRARRTELRAL